MTTLAASPAELFPEVLVSLWQRGQELLRSLGVGLTPSEKRTLAFFQRVESQIIVPLLSSASTEEFDRRLEHLASISFMAEMASLLNMLVEAGEFEHLLERPSSSIRTAIVNRTRPSVVQLAAANLLDRVIADSKLLVRCAEKAADVDYSDPSVLEQSIVGVGDLPQMNLYQSLFFATLALAAGRETSSDIANHLLVECESSFWKLAAQAVGEFPDEVVREFLPDLVKTST